MRRGQRRCQGVWVNGRPCDYGAMRNDKFCKHHKGVGVEQRKYLPPPPRKVSVCPWCAKPLRDGSYLLRGVLQINATIYGADGKMYNDGKHLRTTSAVKNKNATKKYCPQCSLVIADTLMEMGLVFVEAR